MDYQMSIKRVTRKIGQFMKLRLCLRIKNDRKFLNRNSTDNEETKDIKDTILTEDETSNYALEILRDFPHIVTYEEGKGPKRSKRTIHCQKLG